MAMDRLNAIKVFINVVETGSFSAASERMGLSRAAASKYVSQLETHLGGRLLNRTTRHVSTTEPGRLYFERCREILIHLEEADNEASGLSNEPRGNLRISVPTNFASLHLTPLIARFMKTYPKLNVEMESSNRRIDLVDEGFDLAVRMGKLTDSDLIARRLARIRIALVASPDYIKQHGVPKTPDDLKDHACMLYSYTTSGTWPLKKDGKDYPVKIKTAFKSNDPEVLLEAAIAGMGITIMPTFVAGDAIRQGKLTMLLEDYEIMNNHVYIVYSSRRFVPAKIRVFVDFLKEHISDPPYWDNMLTVRC